MLKRRHIFLAVLACSALLLLWLWVQWGAFWKIDRCLDRGGRWNDRTESCEGAGVRKDLPP